MHAAEQTARVPGGILGQDGSPPARGGHADLYARLVQFPRGRVVWRAHSFAEARLGTFPWVALTPALAALVAATLAVSLPSETVSHGKVVGPSLWDSLWPAAAGGAGAVVAIYLILVIFDRIRYRLFGDPIWSSGVVPQGENLTVNLGAGRDPAPELPTVAAVVKLPSDRPYNPPKIFSGDTRWFFMPKPAEKGKYEVRWYRWANGYRAGEIARRPFEITATGVVAERA